MEEVQAVAQHDPTRLGQWRRREKGRDLRDAADGKDAPRAFPGIRD